MVNDPAEIALRPGRDVTLPTTTKASWPAALDAWFGPWRVALLLAVLVVAAFPAVVVGLRTFIHRDFGMFAYPLAAYHRLCFWRGEVPLWNPYNNCGLPFLAQWNTLVCYPGSLVYLLLPMPWSLNLFMLLHLALAGVNMYFLARRWSGLRVAGMAAGIGYAFSGLVLSCLMWSNYMATLAWMPAVVLLAERAWQKGGRHLVFAALVGALQMLSGTPEVILFTWLIVAVLWLSELWGERAARRAFFGRFLFLVLIITALSAVQLLPFADLLAHSSRDGQPAGDRWSMPFTGLVNLVVPLFHTNQSVTGMRFQPDQGCFTSCYVGIGVLALAIWAPFRLRQRRVWLLAVMCLLSVWLAMGDAGGLYALIRRVAPVVNVMRYPAKFMVVTAFLAPLLAAFGIKAWLAHDQESNRIPRSAWRVGGVLLLAAGGAVLLAFLRPLEADDGIVTLKSAGTRLVLLALMGGALVGMRGAGSRQGRFASGLALLGLIWLDPLTHCPAQNPVGDPAALSAPLPPLEELNPRPRLGGTRAMWNLSVQQEMGSKRLANQTQEFLVRRLAQHYNCNLLDLIPRVEGFYALFLSYERDIHFRSHASVERIRPGLADFMGVSQVMTNGRELNWSARPNPMPLITAGQRPVFSIGPKH